MKRFEGQVVVVTGGSKGIGFAIAKQFAQEGAQVIVNYYRSQEKAREAVEEIRATGGEAVSFQANIGEEAAVQALVQFAEGEYSRIDVLVANAATVRNQLLAAMSLEHWNEVIHTNLGGSFLCAREVLPVMMAQGSGAIIFISSIVNERPGVGRGNYVAAKGGINALMRALAVEMAPKVIRVNAVSPGIIETDMSKGIKEYSESSFMTQIPLRRLGDPAEVAKAVCFLASDEASYITGEVLNVTGGYGL